MNELCFGSNVLYQEASKLSNSCAFFDPEIIAFQLPSAPSDQLFALDSIASFKLKTEIKSN
jgi:hypothetical protein